MAGDLLGLDAIATGEHNFRLMALENSEVCEIPFSAIVSTMSVEPEILRRFLQTMSEALNNEYSRSLLLANSRWTALRQFSAKTRRKVRTPRIFGKVVPAEHVTQRYRKLSWNHHRKRQQVDRAFQYARSGID